MSARGEKNVERFTVDMRHVRVRALSRLDEAFRHTVMRLTEQVIAGGEYSPGTPVLTGFARNSWSVGINAPGADRQPSARPLGEELVPVEVTSLDEAQLAIAGAKITEGDAVYLTSNCVYMRKLEYGHSQQAPQGMVRLAMQNAQRIADDVAAQMGVERAGGAP
jgi:hypothetical protein